MGIVVGLIVTLSCLLGGFVAMGGHLGVLVQPFEYVIILGSSIGTFLVANPTNLVTWIPTHIEFAVVGAVILVAVVADELVKRTVATRRARKST